MCIGVEDKHQGSSLSWYDRRMTLALLPLPADVCAITPVSTLLEINLKALCRLHKHFTNRAALLAPGFLFVWLFFVCVHVLVIHVCIWMCACRYVWRLEGNIRCVAYKIGSPSEPATHQVS